MQQLLNFRLQEEEYGIPITEVYEIIFVPSMTKIPHSPEYMVGVIDLRGQIIPVVDLRIQFGGGKADKQPKQRIVVCHMSGQKIGLLVDGVTEVLRIQPEQIESVPPTLVNVDSSYLSGIYKTNDRLIVLLELDSLLQTHQLDYIEQQELTN